MSTERFLAAFLPWCKLKDAHEFEGVRFCPLQFNEIEGLQDENEKKLAKTVFDQYRNIDLSQIPNYTRISIDGHFLTTSGGEIHEFEARIKVACEVLSMAAIASNQPFSGHAYTNSFVFKPVLQSGSLPVSNYVALGFRRRYQDLSDGHTSASLKFTCPPEAHRIENFNLDDKLADAISKLRKKDLKSWKGLHRALRLFLDSSMDYQHRTQAEDLALAVRAMEVLSHLHDVVNPRGRTCRYPPQHPLYSSDKKLIADRLEQMLRADLAKIAWPCIGRGNRSHHRDLDPQESTFWNWFMDAYRLRNQVHHSGVADDSVWTVVEHLQIAPVVFCQLVKHFLAAKGVSVLDSKDQDDTKTISPMLLELDWWPQTQNYQNQSAWHQVRCRVGVQAILDKAPSS